MNHFSPVQTIADQMERDRQTFLGSMLRYLTSDSVSGEDKHHEVVATMNAVRHLGILSGVIDNA